VLTDDGRHTGRFDQRGESAIGPSIRREPIPAGGALARRHFDRDQQPEILRAGLRADLDVEGFTVPAEATRQRGVRELAILVVHSGRLLVPLCASRIGSA
jgi:hypothetical protein